MQPLNLADAELEFRRLAAELGLARSRRGWRLSAVPHVADLAAGQGLAELLEDHAVDLLGRAARRTFSCSLSTVPPQVIFTSAMTRSSALMPRRR